jgi:putative PIN family toxin of toxin-antitoxin system
VKVVLDANVVIAAFAAHGLCEALFEVCLDSHDVLMSDELAGEIGTSLRRKIKLPDSTAESILRLIRDNCTFHQPAAVAPAACRDPEDLHVLGLAAAGDAECLVTGDRDLLALGRFGRCRIVTPRQFSDVIRGN